MLKTRFCFFNVSTNILSLITTIHIHICVYLFKNWECKTQALFNNNKERCANFLFKPTQVKEWGEYSTIIKNKLKRAMRPSSFQDHLQGTKGRKWQVTQKWLNKIPQSGRNMGYFGKNSISITCKIKADNNILTK